MSASLLILGGRGEIRDSLPSEGCRESGRAATMPCSDEKVKGLRL